MIQLPGGNKLMSLSEILANVRRFLASDLNNGLEEGWIEKYGFEIKLLAIAVAEPEDFIRGALK